MTKQTEIAAALDNLPGLVVTTPLRVAAELVEAKMHQICMAQTHCEGCPAAGLCPL